MKKTALSDNLFYIESLGCAKNQVDAELISGILMQNGWKNTSNAEDADCVIINTCSFLVSSRDESTQVIEYYSEQKNKNNYRLLVTGCLPERDNEGILSKFPNIDAIVGINGYQKIHEFAAKKDTKDKFIPQYSGEYEKEKYISRPLSGGNGWAYVKIADGCDNHCTYCAIPAIRGQFHSRQIKDITDEVNNLVENRKVKEIILIAQDTSNYGIDISDKQLLPQLLDELQTISDLKWIRIMYTHPAHMTDEIIAAMKRNNKVLPYIDMPLQHISDRILKDMNRNITKDEITRLISNLKTAIPGIVIRTTFIVGFPGETDEEFNELYNFIKQTQFPRLGVFQYSCEPGTIAANMPGHVSKDISENRFNQIMQLQQKITKKWADKMVGKELEIILTADNITELYPGYSYAGRSIYDSPDVDGLVILKNNANYSPGDILTVKIDKHFIYDLSGRIINPRI